jgi:hypothetical protein
MKNLKKIKEIELLQKILTQAQERLDSSVLLCDKEDAEEEIKIIKSEIDSSLEDLMTETIQPSFHFKKEIYASLDNRRSAHN